MSAESVPSKDKENDMAFPVAKNRILTDQERDGHIAALHALFKTKTRFEFRKVIERAQELSAMLRPDDVVVDVARNYPYGGTSIFGPLFTHAQYVPIDSPLENADERVGYLKELVPEAGGYIGIPSVAKGKIDARVPMPDNSADYYLILNIVEHVKDPAGMLAECRRILKPGGTAIVYAPNVREEHQVPCDYFRYTRYGFVHLATQAGLTVKHTEPVSGVFDVVGMALQHAIGYFPEGQEREEMTRFVMEEMMPKLEGWEKRFCSSIGENDTTVPVPDRKEFPVAYLFTLRK